MEATMKNLIICFEYAKSHITEADYIALLIEMPEFEKPELIVDPKENYDKKLEYLQDAYDENLNHKHSKGVRIIAFASGNEIDELAEGLANFNKNAL
jgi:hypothetical protein